MKANINNLRKVDKYLIDFAICKALNHYSNEITNDGIKRLSEIRLSMAGELLGIKLDEKQEKEFVESNIKKKQLNKKH